MDEIDIVIFLRHEARNSFDGMRAIPAYRMNEAADTIETLRRELAEANARTERVRPCD